MSKNLGLVKAIFRQATSPVLTDVLWYDTVNKILKYFHTTTLTWRSLMRSQLTGTLTPITPTDEDITTVIGLTATQAGVGFQVTIFNLNDSKLYSVESDGSNWFYKVFGSITYSDWFLPSIYELAYMHANLHAYGVGDFKTVPYGIWNHVEYLSSSENDATNGIMYEFEDPGSGNIPKDGVTYIRACRSFTTTDIYSLRDIGPAGGWIFYIVNNGGGSYTYYEAAPSDSDPSCFSNIINSEIGIAAQGIDIGTGQSNTNAIMGQVGHIDSAAKLCNDLII